MESTKEYNRRIAEAARTPKRPRQEMKAQNEVLRARIAELEIDRDAYAASARQARTERDALQAHLSLAENVCKAADKAPCRHSNDHTELGCEVCDALAAWRAQK